MNDIQKYKDWRKTFFKSLRKCYEHKVFGLRPSIEKVFEDEIRPNRENSISNDDITNLKIALGNGTIDDFIKNI